MIKTVGVSALFGVVLLLGTKQLAPSVLETAARAQSGLSNAENQVPVYEWDPTWPKRPLPNKWAVGHMVGVSIDAKDHIWIVQRPRTYNPPQGECCMPAPAVMEFDQAGNIVQAWGGPRAEDFPKQGHGGPRAGWIETGTISANVLMWSPPSGYPWPEMEHNIFVDYRDNIWLGNNGGVINPKGGSHYLKFTRQGKFLLQIGRAGATGQGSNDTDVLKSPTGAAVDAKTNEVFIADGYFNRRVIVFDADTGAYKRHWGAYGKRPDDSIPFKYNAEGPPSRQFETVHCVVIDKDDLVWVCDRSNSRIQVFKKDGTFVKEASVAPQTLGGSVFDLALSRDPGQRFGFVADGRNNTVWILRRSDMKVIGSVGYNGHWGGAFTMAHNLGVDSKNHLYVSEGGSGQRVQRFLYKGLRPASGVQ